MSGCLQQLCVRGWDVLRLRGERVEADILPGKGADILAIRWLPRQLDLLWRSPWGLRARGAVSTAPSGAGVFLEQYPGGWQTIFPNGGAAAALAGVEQPFHGEATLASWDWERDASAALGVRLSTRLTRSPFHLTKRIRVDDDAVLVEETIVNEGQATLDVMWSHHPAFGEPLLGAGCRIDADARTFIADDERDVVHGDLQPGSSSPWPHAISRTGGRIDISRVPDERTPCDRFGYLLDFNTGRIAISNEAVGLRATLLWDLDVMPCAWYWLEAHATTEYPWFGAAYVLGLEPASSFPGQGIVSVRNKGGSLVRFDPGQERTARITLRIEEISRLA